MVLVDVTVKGFLHFLSDIKPPDPICPEGKRAFRSRPIRVLIHVSQ